MGPGEPGANSKGTSSKGVMTIRSSPTGNQSTESCWVSQWCLVLLTKGQGLEGRLMSTVQWSGEGVPHGELCLRLKMKTSKEGVRGSLRLDTKDRRAFWKLGCGCNMKVKVAQPCPTL